MRKSGRLSDISVNTNLRVLRAFMHWLAEQKFQELVKVHLIRCEQPIPVTFQNEDLSLLFKAEPRCMREKRVILMSMVVADCGLRARECLAIRMDDINLANLELIIRKAKGRKPRIVPITETLRREISPLMTVRKPDEFLFQTQNGTALRYRNALRDFKYLCKRLHITRPKTAWHTLRHTFATNYISMGGNVVHLQRILGHSKLEMTMRYVHLQTKDLARISSLTAAIG
jgi:site-specific recombinase XerD